jgi:hypothetical protein
LNLQYKHQIKGGKQSGTNGKNFSFLNRFCRTGKYLQKVL